MTIKAYTSRERFDEKRRFTGSFQQMGRVALDADWNEEVRIRTIDARRRTSDLANGSPDDGFRIVNDFMIDPIESTAGWVGTGLLPGDLRIIPKEIVLDRRDLETLPFVLRIHGWTAMRHTLRQPLNLTKIPVDNSTPFSASNLVVSVRFEREPTDDEADNIQLVIADKNGERSAAANIGTGPTTWTDIIIPAGAFPGIDLTNVISWGLTGLPPRAKIWIDGLRAQNPALGDDVVIRGGDGSVHGAGRLFVEGVRVFREDDLRYTAQPDLPAPPALATLPTDGSKHHFFYLDVWEQTVTALDDPFLVEPALDGLDTNVRLKLVSQVRVVQNLVDNDPLEVMPDRIGGGRLTTNIASGALPDRIPPEKIDPCRDRCLLSESVSTGDGYIGTDNVNVRIEIFQGGAQPIVMWSRDNASTVVPLTQAVSASGAKLQVDPTQATKFLAGDLIVVEDRTTRLQPEGPRFQILRQLRGVDAATGTLELEDAGKLLTPDAPGFFVGGALGTAFDPANGACIRRWDGADLLVTNVRYRLPDGITFAFSGTATTNWRTGDWWNFCARVQSADGASHGVVDQLTNAPVQGPIHHLIPLARVYGGATARTFVDLRPRFLPLNQIRDRLIELDKRHLAPGAFTVVVGDGIRTHGDIDQDLAEGVTGDEAIQAALQRLNGAGGTIYLRAGIYHLPFPVLMRFESMVNIIGDGEATELRVQGVGGAFYLDHCGHDGAVNIEGLHMVVAPNEEVTIGTGTSAASGAVLAQAVVSTTQPLDRILATGDVLTPITKADFLTTVATTIKTLQLGQGRAAGPIVATLVQLRQLQIQNPGANLQDLAAAQPLLNSLTTLPHGVVTIADSMNCAVSRCHLESGETAPEASGVMITGTCQDLVVEENRIHAAVGVAGLPYAPYFSPAFLGAFPRAGLFLQFVRVSDNEIQSGAAAITGIHFTDGAFDGVEIRSNRVNGFTVGILFDDQPWMGHSPAPARTLIDGNQVFDSDSVGIQVNADGADVSDNEVRNAVSAELFQAAIQVAGSGHRVRNCWIELPASDASSQLAVVAGIVIGDGLDDGRSTARAVFDVEVDDNRIEGAGEQSVGVGILVAGPQPIYDVRVRGNVIRNLGDAGVRTFSLGGGVGRLRVEDNRVEQVALADVPVSATDIQATVTKFDANLAKSLFTGTTVINTPRLLLQALLNSSLPSVRGPLDGVLRWIERGTLRGGVVLSGVEQGVVRNNHLAAIGTAHASATGLLDGATVRVAGVAVVGGADIVVDGNQIEGVVAPVIQNTGVSGDTAVARPPIYDVLLALDQPVPGETVTRADVHAALTSLRQVLVQYAGGTADTRKSLLQNRIVAPSGAIEDELENIGGTGIDLAGALERQLAALKAATAVADQTTAADQARTTVTQALAFTGADQRSQTAWDTAAQWDSALAVGTADAINGAVKQIQDAFQVFTYNAGADLVSNLQTALAAYGGATLPQSSQNYVVANLLGQVAIVRDLQEQQTENDATDQIFGTRRTIVDTFVSRLQDSVNALTTGDATTASRKTIAQIMTEESALADQLRGVNDLLASQLDVDFRDLNRSGATNLSPIISRIKVTLKAVSDWAAGDSGAAEGVPTLLVMPPATAARRILTDSTDPSLADSTQAGLPINPNLGVFWNLGGQTLTVIFSPTGATTPVPLTSPQVPDATQVTPQQLSAALAAALGTQVDSVLAQVDNSVLVVGKQSDLTQQISMTVSPDSSRLTALSAVSVPTLTVQATLTGTWDLTNEVVQLTYGIDGTTVVVNVNAANIAKVTPAELAKGITQAIGANGSADAQNDNSVVITGRQGMLALVATPDSSRFNTVFTPGGPIVSPSDRDRAVAASRQSLINLFVNNLDKQVAGLAAAPEATAQKGLRALKVTTTALPVMLNTYPDLQTLGTQADAAIGQAIAETDMAKRADQLASARSLFDQIRLQTTIALPANMMVQLPQSPQVPLAKRLAAMGALVITLKDLPLGDVRNQGVTIFRNSLDLVLQAEKVASAVRDQSLANVDSAASILTNTASGDQVSQALANLMHEAESAASRAVDSGDAETNLQSTDVLLQAASTALDPAEDTGTRVLRTQIFLQSRSIRLSPSVAAQLSSKSDLPTTLDGLEASLERIARGESNRIPIDIPPIFPAALKPADGVFVAATDARMRLAGNMVYDSVYGISVLGPSGHVLTPPTLAPGVLVEVAGNRLGGCALSGLNIQPEVPAVAVITDNQIFACAGIAEVGAPNIGQAVATFAGTGDLILRNNMFQENGHQLPNALLHEMLVNWRGDLVLRGNTIRHVGGGKGGAGVLVIAEDLSDTTLVAKLSAAPFLTAEPPPKPSTTGRPPAKSQFLLPDASLAKLTSVVDPSNLVQLGAFTQMLPSGPVLNRALTVMPLVATKPVVAQTTAANYLNKINLTLNPPIIDWLKFPPIFIAPQPVVKPQRSVQFEGNDVSATGPALLLLAEGNDIVAANVVGNELRSLGGTGAAYVRKSDSTVFSSNRCECVNVVVVVVLRPGQAPVSVVGNVLVGAEPIIPPPPPPKPTTVNDTGLSLNFPVGAGGHLSIPLDATTLLGNLERKKQLSSDVFTDLVSGMLVQQNLPAQSAAQASQATNQTVAQQAGSQPIAFADQVVPAGVVAAKPTVSPAVAAAVTQPPAAAAPAAAKPATPITATPAVPPAAATPAKPAAPAAATTPATPAAPPTATTPAKVDTSAPKVSGTVSDATQATISAAAANVNVSKADTAAPADTSAPAASAPAAAAPAATPTVTPTFVINPNTFRFSGNQLINLNTGGLSAVGINPFIPNLGTGLTLNTGASGTSGPSVGNQQLGPVLQVKGVYQQSGFSDTSQEGALKQIVDRVTQHTDDPTLAKANIQAVLNSTGGDAVAALSIIDRQILGVDSAAPTVREALAQNSLLHDVLADAIYTGDQIGKTSAIASVPEPTPNTPPDPYSKSLVIIGGTRVAVVANCATAGVVVQEADTHVELNP